MLATRFLIICMIQLQVDDDGEEEKEREKERGESIHLTSFDPNFKMAPPPPSISPSKSSQC